MAGRSRIWARKRHQTSDAGGLGSDIAVTPIARARDWALGLMIIASAGALLATSDDHPPDFEFKVSSSEFSTRDPKLETLSYLKKIERNSALSFINSSGDGLSIRTVVATTLSASLIDG